MKQKYGALRIVAALHRILGGLLILGGVWGWLSIPTHEPLALLPFLGVIVAGVFAFAFGELITLLIDIEYNTRQTPAPFTHRLPTEREP
jgi:hypothetical protein